MLTPVVIPRSPFVPRTAWPPYKVWRTNEGPYQDRPPLCPFRL